MRVAKASDKVLFGGGFVCSDPDQLLGHDDLLHYRLSYRRWLQLTRSSAVLNTPGVHGCLGWKLCEYLALGKAIISTTIQRQLPADLEHGTHIHVVDGSEDSIGMPSIASLATTPTGSAWRSILAPTSIVT